jgi:hypothetical protein
VRAQKIVDAFDGNDGLAAAWTATILGRLGEVSSPLLPCKVQNGVYRLARGWNRTTDRRRRSPKRDPQE